MKTSAQKMTFFGMTRRAEPAEITMSETATSYLARALWILAFTIATALAAQVKVPLPGNAVPMTMQTAVVLLAGLRLGSRDGALSQILYVAGGACGLPFFAGAAGAAVLLGPTGGYLIGFIFAAWLAGAISTRKSFFRAWIVAFVASLVIFAFGAVQLKWVMQMSWMQALTAGVAPFLIGDLVKVTLAATAAAIFRR